MPHLIREGTLLSAPGRKAGRSSWSSASKPHGTGHWPTLMNYSFSDRVSTSCQALLCLTVWRQGNKTQYVPWGTSQSIEKTNRQQVYITNVYCKHRYAQGRLGEYTILQDEKISTSFSKTKKREQITSPLNDMESSLFFWGYYLFSLGATEILFYLWTAAVSHCHAYVCIDFYS